MNRGFGLPDWLRDPEWLWPRIAAGLAALVVVLLGVCLHLADEKGRYQAELAQAVKVNDHQRQVVSQISEELEQVVSRLDKLAEDQKRVATVSVGRTEGVAGERESRVHTLSADLNGDGIVDWSDFELLGKDWGKTGVLAADLDQDYAVTMKDFNIFADQWLQTESWYVDSEDKSSSSVAAAR